MSSADNERLIPSPQTFVSNLGEKQCNTDGIKRKTCLV